VEAPEPTTVSSTKAKPTLPDFKSPEKLPDPVVEEKAFVDLSKRKQRPVEEEKVASPPVLAV
jgi:hypothetical protein